MNIKNILVWVFKIAFLTILYIPIWVLGSMAIADLIPDTPSETGSNVKPWWTALLMGSLLAVPHLVHILSNPLMPVASVRHSHMIETTTSSFLFGLIIVWLLHRKHSDMKNFLVG